MTKKQKRQYSKKMIDDIRSLLWVVTIGGLLLAGMCIRYGYTGALPWLTTMVSLPWAAHGAVCTVYLGVAKADHQAGGITYDAAAARGFVEDNQQATI